MTEPERNTTEPERNMTEPERNTSEPESNPVIASAPREFRMTPGANRRAAVNSLLILAAGLALALLLDRLFWPGNLWLAAFIAGCEAGLVGGLTDWFAVTALFRHPFGLRLPHTAILPNNRDRITDALVSMVENDLLHKESLLAKIKQLDAARRLMTGIRAGLRLEAVRAILTQVMQSVLIGLPLEDIRNAIRHLLADRVKRADFSSLLRLLTEEGLKRNLDTETLDAILEKSSETIAGEDFQLKTGQMAMAALQHMHLKGLLKLSLPALAGLMGERKVGALIQEFLLTSVKDLGEPENATRGTLLTYIRDGIGRLPENPSLLARLDDWLEEGLSSDKLDTLLNDNLQQIRMEGIRKTIDPRFLDDKVLPLLEDLIDSALRDDGMMARLEAFLGDQLGQLVDTHHKKIGMVVRENIDKFETDSLVHLIEDKVGDDLQWIRVNGAVSGFLVGLFLFGTKQLVLLLYPK